MGPNMKIGAKCLQNVHLKLNDEGMLIHDLEEVIEVGSEVEEVEKEEEKLREGEQEEKEEKEQGPVPTDN